MRMAIAALAASVICSPAHAWERKTVMNEIEKYCEGKLPDNWPLQTACIHLQQDALMNLRPPLFEGDDYSAAYRACKAKADEFDFDKIKECYEQAAAEIADKANEQEAKEQLANFNSLPLVATCPRGPDTAVIREAPKKGKWDILVQIGKEPPKEGTEGGAGYSWEGQNFIEFDGCKVFRK